MASELTGPARDLADSQSGVISRKQAIEHGVRPDTIDGRLRTGRWRQMQRGVYSIYTGEPQRAAVLWAAVLRAGPNAMLSHQTAAEVSGIVDGPSSLIHVTVPVTRQVARIPDVVIHRSSRALIARTQNMSPPRTRVEETVLDLAARAATFDRAFSFACAACQRRLATPATLATAMTARPKLRWRSELTEALADIRDGVHSLLEYRYVHRVEQPHRLPTATRQACIVWSGRNHYLDNLYREFGLCVELDGKQAHPEDHRWDDIRRDNAAAAEGVSTLRYGWAEVSYSPCRTAVQVGSVLQGLGWTGILRQCGPACPVAPATLRRTS